MVERVTFKLEPEAGVMPSAPEAVISDGVETEVATTSVPVKFAALEIVCELIKPEVIAPEERFSEEPVAAPIFGVTRVGVLAKTRAPEPISSEIKLSNCKEVVADSADRLLAALTITALASGKV